MGKILRYTEKLGREVVARLVGPPTRYHIIPSISGSTWRILYEGKLRAIRVFKTKEEAIAYAKNSPNKSITEVVVHDDENVRRFRTLSLTKPNNAIS